MAYAQPISIIEWLSDFDNEELPPMERKEELLESVRSYNYQYDKALDPETCYNQYISWSRKKGYEDSDEAWSGGFADNH